MPLKEGWTPSGCPKNTKCMECTHYNPYPVDTNTICPYLPQGTCKKWGGFTYGIWYGWVNIHTPEDYDIKKEIAQLKQDYEISKIETQKNK